MIGRRLLDKSPDGGRLAILLFDLLPSSPPEEDPNATSQSNDSKDSNDSTSCNSCLVDWTWFGRGCDLFYTGGRGGDGGAARCAYKNRGRLSKWKIGEQRCLYEPDESELCVCDALDEDVDDSASDSTSGSASRPVR